MQVLCPTCHGRGYIPDPRWYGKPYCYYNPNTGSSYPEIFCQTCSGTGWVATPDQVYPWYPERPRPLWSAPRRYPTYYVGDPVPITNPVTTVCHYEFNSYTTYSGTYC